MRLFGIPLGKQRAEGGLDLPSTASRHAGRGFGEFRGGNNEVFGRWTEAVARGMGTPWFLLVLTLFCAAWLVFNSIAPGEWRFDSAALGFTALTLILSLQASYAAPMILLAQNRQDDRDRVQIEQDRQRAERNLADTEFLAREVVALRLAIKDLPDRDFVRAELRALLADLDSDPESGPDSEQDPGEMAGSGDGAAIESGDSAEVGPNGGTDGDTATRGAETQGAGTPTDSDD